MHRSPVFIALFFLVLLCRVVVPDAAILALHQHEHLEHEQVQHSSDEVSQAHIHCHVDDFDNSNFLLTDFFASTAIVVVPGYYTQPCSYTWKFTYPNNSLLRGPPTA
ncbi:hypothetical protein FVR03_19040 [Pontibacter qinzhouensis]|uniref:DUF2946 domain-containing protein n=1 Tax=Pontibacter qinzhouensis TaxID=2603253 RepID=A0A5C8J781_9BACT|nr:hypothetical protein [Pontibacter qinzhouensis]TXK33298.1 hypothetical protein FVR03_19040 [Pontibacter qinzhouensis]